MAKKIRRANVAEELASQDGDEMVGVRMDEKLYQAIGDYADKVDAESISAAIRELLSIGLTETGMMENGKLRTIKENARRAAIHRMTACMQAAISTFRDQDLEFEEEVGEE